MKGPVELYTTAGCPYSAATREDLEWRGIDFVEYDVQQDREAYDRMLELTGGNRTVPVTVEEGKPIQVGWMGQGTLSRAHQLLPGQPPRRVRCVVAYDDLRPRALYASERF
jgi:glutaredoxin 3